MVLNFYERAWNFNEEACPCDSHFTSFLNASGFRNKVIFHFGTGAHHHVALESVRLGLQNQIIGVTCSKQEYISYMDMVSSNTLLAQFYKVLYADIYTLSPLVLPQFDLVTLFHLGEYWNGIGDGMNGAPSKDSPLDDFGLFKVMWTRTKPEGLLSFYVRSAGWARTEPVIKRAIDLGWIQDAGSFNSILLFKKPAAARSEEASRILA